MSTIFILNSTVSQILSQNHVIKINVNQKFIAAKRTKQSKYQKYIIKRLNASYHNKKLNFHWKKKYLFLISAVYISKFFNEHITPQWTEVEIIYGQLYHPG